EKSKHLIAYYVSAQKDDEKEKYHSDELKAYLKTKLPEYMIPSFFISLDQVPLTPNGKIDRKALMSRKIVLSKDAPCLLPQSDIEKNVLEIWRDVLKIENIGTMDGFFEVGGDSVSAVILAERVSNAFHVSFTAANIFKYSNVRQISQFVNKMNKDILHAQTEMDESTMDCARSLDISDWKNSNKSYPEYYKESLAIIGMSCHFPGAKNHQEFWSNLKEGKESAQFFSKEELRKANVAEETIQNPNYVPMQLSIEGKEFFDSGFFNIPPNNASLMDPQFRQLLLHSWQAIEDAGYDCKNIPNTGVFMSVSNNYYQALLKNSNTVRESDEYVAWLLTQGGTIPTMISYKLGLRGPSVFIHSNCSSALTALSSAYQNLQLNEARYALVGASTLFASSHIGYVYQPGLNFSSDGHCKTFDASADGMVGGEGVGVIVVKKALDAIEDGDHIYALLRGIALNNDGSDKAGFYAPSVNGQSEVIQKVLTSTGVDPESISYVEAHGTGTKLGDPIEVLALTDVYQKYTSKKQFCALGSVKSNIGHLDTAAGLAGCMKVALSLKNKEVPPSINYTSPNPEIDFENSPFYVVDHLKKWRKESSPRRAALSSFGIGGTNAHAILEEYQAVETAESKESKSVPDQENFLVLLSAKNDERVHAYAEKLLAFLKGPQDSPPDLRDLSYTLQVGRKAMQSRVIFIVHSVDELIKKLEVYTGTAEGLRQGKPGNCFQGDVKKSAEGIQLFEDDEDSQELIHKWITKGKLKKIAEFWTRGGRVDWKSLYQGNQPHRMSLPTYPFASERYWIEEHMSKIAELESGDKVSLHPLLKENRSDLPEQRFEGKIPEKPEKIGTLMVKPVWKEKNVAPADNTPGYSSHLVMSYGVKSFSSMAKGIEAQIEGVSCVQLKSQGQSMEKRYLDIAIQVFETIKSILEKKYKGRILIQLLIPSRDEGEIFAGLSGLLKTAHLENSKFSGQLIEVGPQETGEKLPGILKENSQCPEDVKIRYRMNQRQVASWEEVLPGEGSTTIPWKDNGIYLITGGAGGLGLIFSKEIARTIKDPVLFLTGRSQLSTDKQNQLKELESLGARIEYRQVDMGRRKEVDDLIKGIKEDFGSLRGILHSAGVINDNFIIKKTAEEFKDVLAPKVAGTVNLDQATRDINLDFFVLFSSISGPLGNPGQSDYSAANAFMDAYSGYRNDLVSSNERQGQTLSINWPLWKEGGMRVDEALVEMMKENGGMVAMETSSGIQALIHGLAMDQSQIMVMEGDLSRTGQGLLGRKSKAKSYSIETSIPQIDNNILEEKTLLQLKCLLGEVLKLSVDRIDSRESLESYGIDSIIITQLNQRLETIFGEITKTLFFEFQTLSALADYFIAEYPQECIAWAGAAPSLCSEAPSTSVALKDETPVLTSLKPGKIKAHHFAQTGSGTQVQEPIAIIGVAGHYPKADTMEEYWENLKTGKNCITEIPSQRWALEGFYEVDIEKAVDKVKSYSRLGGFLENFSGFDPLFFNIPPVAVFNMDPQERLMLTTCWEAMEASGYSMKSLQDKYHGSVGVFIGVTKSGFNLHTHLGPDLETSRLPSTSFSSMANRVSYHLNLTGPSMAIDTMCSSSITVIHEACEHIRRGDCQLALAGAVNLYLHPQTYIDLCLGKMITDEGEIHCFSKTGKGFIPGEGVGTVLLKSLSQAIADGDHIEGIIRGTKINHGGKTNGYTVPNLVQQRELIHGVLERAGCDASDIDYIESAANGSAMGDAIEFEALRQVFQKCPTSSCWLGTLKPNIGHLEAASGISQLTKVLCQMKYQTLAPTLVSSDRLDESLHWEQGPFRLVTGEQTWLPSEDAPHKALITSFGAGGSYAAMVVEEYIKPVNELAIEVNVQDAQLIILSARTEVQLRHYAKRLQKYLKRVEVSLPSIAYTLQQGRDFMRYRLAILAKDQKGLLVYLEAYLQNQSSGPVKTGDARQFKTMREYLPLQEIEDRVCRALSKRDLESLAYFWLKGYDDIVWNDLYDGQVTRCNLPTYPFESRSFWYEDQKAIIPGSQPDVQSTLHSLDIKEPEESLWQERDLQSLDEIQANLVAVIKDILFMHEEDELDEEASFLDIGLDSISVVRFIQKLSQKLNLSLRETLVFDYPTIGALAEYIAQLPSQKVQRQACQDALIEGGLLLFKDHLGRIMKDYEEVVPLQIEGKGPLLFCIHPMSGDVGIYTKMAEAAQGRFRVIGIKSKGFLTNKSPLASIEAMGEYNAEIMISIDPEGPYHLLGASMGGTVAYESARCLQSKNKIVKTLFLIESPLIENGEDAGLWDSDDIHNWIMNANFLMITMLHMDPDFRQRKEEGVIQWSKLEITYGEVKDVAEERLVESLVDLIGQRGVKQSRDVLIQRLESMSQIHLANLRGLSRYRATHFPRQEDLTAILLRTRTAKAVSEEVYNPDYLINVQQAKGSMSSFFECWKKVLPQLETKVVDGENHFDLLNTQTTIQQMCDLIARSMDSLLQPLPTALVGIEQNRQISHSSEIENKIAIVGMSGQFPGAKTLDDFWGLLKNGQSVFTEFPQNRDWDLGNIYDKDQRPNKTYIRHGGFLEDIDRFDPLFFQITPKEAEMMDPSERFFLQESWKAIEDAGIDPTSLSGKPWGVFCGGGGDYTLSIKEISGMSPHVTVSNIPGRVSYSLNLTGPCLSVDVGCASSLLAVSQACDHLILNKCKVAIAGGVLIYSTPNLIITGCQTGLFSQDGQSRAFSARANGMMPGEAVGVLVLKPLAKALADGDRIHGVIEGWGNNHNGKTNGMAAPSVMAEAALFSDVYRRFQINPETISMVEANATGTPLGDTMEVQALTEAFQKMTEKRNFCALGSVENNIGHSFQNSGMNHVMKVLLALRHGEIPATLNVETLNPSLDLDNSPFFINNHGLSWNAETNQIRRAAVSSFGATGTNVHLVITEAPVSATQSAWHYSESGRPVLIVLSGKTKTALKQRCIELKEFLERQDDQEYPNLSQLSANLLLRRSHFSERSALVVSNQDELHARLLTLINEERPDDAFTGTARKDIGPSLYALGRMTAKTIANAKKPEKEDLLVMADLYVQGVLLDLSDCFSEAEKFPLSLPAYPFETRKCWIGSPDEVSSSHKEESRTSSSLLATIQEQVAEITSYKIDEVDVDANFSQLGLDSLMSMRLLAAVNDEFSLEIQLVDLLDHNTIRRLVALIEKENIQNKKGPEEAIETISSEVFSGQAGWSSNRLSQLPNALHITSLGGENIVTREMSMESCRQSLVNLTKKGIAIFHEGDKCYFLSHRSIDIQSVLDSLSPEQRHDLLAQLPTGMLIAPVSQEQERNLYHSEVTRQSAWNIQHVYESSISPLDIPLLNKAMAHVIENHDLLRTYYLSLGTTWAQIIVTDAKLEFQILDLPGLPDFQKFIATERNRLLRLDNAPLLQAWICQTNNACYLGFVTHHSLADAFTITMLFSELMSYYQSLLKQQKTVLKPVTEQYWQYSLCQFDAGIYRSSKTIQYWTDQLHDGVLPIQLPYARDPQEVEEGLLHVADGNVISLSTTLSNDIKRFSQDHEITYTQLFTTAVTMLLIHGMGNARAIVQFVNNQRDRVSLMNTLGEFTNILFIPFDVDPESSVIHVLREVKQKSLNSLRFAKIDFSELLTLTGLDNYEGYYQQLGDVIIDSADIDTGTLDSSKGYGHSLFVDVLSQKKQSLVEGKAVATLFYQILKVDQSIHFITTYRKHLFDKLEIQQLSTLIVQIVEEMIHNPEQKVNEILSRMHDSIERLKNQAKRYKIKSQIIHKKSLSEGQKGLWLLQELEPNMSAYNVPIAFKIHDKIQMEFLKQAFEFMLKKHPILQTVITTDGDGSPLQYINKERALSFSQKSIHSLSEEELSELLKTTFKQPFKLDGGPLMRAHLFSLSSDEHILLVTIHHIIFDGTSILILINDLLSAYKTYSQGQRPVLKTGKTPSYFDFVDWEQELLVSEKGEKHLAYWKEQLAGELPLLELPIDKTRPARQTYTGATCSVRLSTELTGQLRHLAKEQGVSLFVLLLGVYKALLCRYTNQGDIIVGVPTLGRPEKRFELVVGYFINMVAMRSTINENHSFSYYLDQLKRTVAYGLGHAVYPFPKLVTQLNLKPDPTHSPVFQTIFVLQNFYSIQAQKELTGKNPGISIIPDLQQEGDFDLSMEMAEGEHDLSIHLSYNLDLFNEETIIRFIEHFIKLAQEIVQNPDQEIGQYDLLSKKERDKHLIEWNNTKANYPEDKHIHQLFENQASNTPDAVAVVFEGKQLTYRELNQKSTQLAKYLQSLGVKPDTLVAICVERSLEMIVGIMGILKAGGAFVPLDPDYPEDRLRYMLKDSRVKILITREELTEKVSAFVSGNNCAVCVIDKQWDEIMKIKGRLVNEVQSGNLAYVIYTSGSIGRPKGVLISHDSLVNHCQVTQNYYNLTPDDHILQFASLNVDASLEQILPGLIKGATSILRDKEVWSPGEFQKKVRDNEITVADVPPAYLRELLLDWSHASELNLQEQLRLVIVGGEALSPETVDLWRSSPMNSTRLINAYGPTETTITSTVFEITADTQIPMPSQNIPIGRPLDNESVYILDGYRNPVPVGVRGELYISGTGVALGYLNRPELTREKFIDNHFNPGTRMYKTGDLARWLADGNIEFLGRIDHQVKVRGFRIECGEIESVLNEQENIGNTLVLAKTINESVQLVAYFVPVNPGSSVDIEKLKNALKAKLPDYMIPSAFVSLDEIPLTPNGKTDRRALALHDIDLAGSKKYIAPVTETERQLADIWEEILGVEQIGVLDNFFDLGGHSLLSVRLMAEIHNKFGRDLPISTLIQTPTVKEQASMLQLPTENEHRGPLISIQPKGDRTPFFCVHPVGGNVLSYMELTRQLGNHHPFYGLQSPGLNGGVHPESIEKMASLYIEAIRTIQRQGPYCLGGWSMGGIIAYEMAQQLQQTGEEISLIALIESYTPSALKLIEDYYNKEHNLGKYGQEYLMINSFARDLFGGMIPEIQAQPNGHSNYSEIYFESILEHAKKSEDPILDRMGTKQIRKLFGVYMANTHAMNNYKPKPYKGKIVLFNAEGDADEADSHDPTMGWEKLAEDGLFIRNISANHYTILREPQVKILADGLRKFLT
ncbi:MAG: amino acid adenylation domain-containing protein, partial [Candidatus Scalindua sp.]|nr:amino acid adenylation domain-containing protein [Candidatus Scalindua sp.]